GHHGEVSGFELLFRKGTGSGQWDSENKLSALSHHLNRYRTRGGRYPAFSIIVSETLRFSTISRVTSNSFTFFWLGRWYIRSSMSSSRIIRRPRAPTLRTMAWRDTARSASSLNF